MRTNQFKKAALLAAFAELLLNDQDVEFMCVEPQPRDERGRFASRCRCNEPRFNRPMMDFGGFEPTPRAPWGVCDCPPREDKNKVFGLHVEVDEPRREDYCSRWAFERDHAKFDRLVDAAEACDWQNKSNTAPKHRVNAIRRRLEDGPVMGVDLVGETQWW